MTAPVASSNTATTKTINIIEAAGLPFDSRALRDVLGAFVTGVTVITALDEAGTPYGLTANSFSSVSLDPPLVLWSQALTAPSHPVFRAADRFAINILACDQVEISNRFARAADRKFEGVPVRVGLGGLPLLEGCAAYLECRKITSYPSRALPAFTPCGSRRPPWRSSPPNWTKRWASAFGATRVRPSCDGSPPGGRSVPTCERGLFCPFVRPRRGSALRHICLRS